MTEPKPTRRPHRCWQRSGCATVRWWRSGWPCWTGPRRPPRRARWRKSCAKRPASTAHKLAGSLGMYGYDEGTRIAREIEVLLGGEATPDAARLGDLVAELRRAVFPEVKP